MPPQIYADLIDVSNWQFIDPNPPVGNWQLVKDTGIVGVAFRFAVGNYYIDPSRVANWDAARAVGLKVTGYFVTAPKNKEETQVITVQQHIDKFTEAMGDRVPDLPWVIDAELKRGATKTQITDLHEGVIEWFIGKGGFDYPFIYTRQNFWDVNTYARFLFTQCPLWPARYNSNLEGPWADGYYKFRDWDNWVLWQHTSSGSVPGLPGEIDLDVYHGTNQDFYDFCNGVLTQKQKIDILWREAGLHNWNLLP